jgi:adenylylsulfate kinase
MTAASDRIVSELSGEPTSGVVIWVTGLPSSGKSTFAGEMALRLRASGRATCVLDGDDVRGALSPRPGYDAGARDAFYATLGRLAALIAAQGVCVIVAATSHRAVYRRDARRVFPQFLEVFVDADPIACRVRDSKGLYAASVAGLPGGDVVYERPTAPDVVAAGGHDEAAARRVLALLDRWEGRA